MSDNINTISDLINYLEDINNSYKAAFSDISTVRCSKNMNLVDFDELITDKDEVAFFSSNDRRIMIKVQRENFFLEDEVKKLLKKNNNVGAISSFIGIVRNKYKNQDLVSMTLEHYSGMAEKMLKKIEDEALDRWKLLDSLIIHRFGELFPGDNIVLVYITLSEHRKEAVNACHFFNELVENKAFLKYEKTSNSGHWVQALESDNIEERK